MAYPLKKDVINEIVKIICEKIDAGEYGDNVQSEELLSFEIAKNKSEGIQKIREANDEEYRSYITNLLDSMLNEDGDYVTKNGEAVFISSKEKAQIIEQVFGNYRGFGLIGPLLMDEEVTELMINGPDNLFIEKNGKVIRLDTRFCEDTDCEEEERIKRGEVQLRRIIHRIADRCNREVNEANPIVDARLGKEYNGSRVNIVLKPIAMHGDTVTIRKFSKKPMSIERLIELGSITNEIASKLKMLVAAKYNIFISGQP